MKKVESEDPAAEQPKETGFLLRGQIPFLVTISKTNWDVKIENDMTVQFVCFGLVESCLTEVVKNQVDRWEEDQKLPKAKRKITRTSVNDLIKFQKWLRTMQLEMTPYMYDVASKAELDIEIVPSTKFLDKDGK